jgi:hypothetical protein
MGRTRPKYELLHVLKFCKGPTISDQRPPFFAQLRRRPFGKIIFFGKFVLITEIYFGKLFLHNRFIFGNYF